MLPRDWMIKNESESDEQIGGEKRCVDLCEGISRKMNKSAVSEKHKSNACNACERRKRLRDISRPYEIEPAEIHATHVKTTCSRRKSHIGALYAHGPWGFVLAPHIVELPYTQ